MTFVAGQTLTAAQLNDLDIDSLVVDTDVLVVDKTNNRVGIGTTSPQQELNIAANSPSLRLTDTDTALSNNERSSSIEFFSSDSSGTGVAAYIHADGDGSTGNLQLQFGTGTPGGASDRMTIRATGSVSIPGSLSKGSGSFRIPHPLPAKAETHHLVHSFVEAPQADNIYRGRIALTGGAATVDLNDAAGMTTGTFELLNRDLQCFVVNNQGWTAVRGSVSGSTLTIEAQDASCTETVDWLVVGERHDQHMYDTEWTDDDGRVIVEPLRPAEPEPDDDSDASSEDSESD